MKMVALIPARAGSKRIPGKNTRMLAGKPLIAWTIEAALESGVFEDIVISSDDLTSIPREYGVHMLARPRELATDDSPDIEWVKDALTFCQWPGHAFDAFAILRPTSPFRTADTIRRAFNQFEKAEAHSLRAVQPVKEHPFKMWSCQGPGHPLMPMTALSDGDTPCHSMPTQTLPKFYVQNASLEMAWTYIVNSFGTISGKKVMPFFTEGYEGFDLNTEDDWQAAERLIAEGKVALPALARL